MALTVRLPEQTEKKLTRLSSETGRSKSYYVREAIDQFLEDREDYLLGLSVLEKQESMLDLNELRKELGLGH